MSYENHRMTAAKSILIRLLLGIPALATAQFDLLGEGAQGGEGAGAGAPTPPWHASGSPLTETQTASLRQVEALVAALAALGRMAGLPCFPSFGP